MVDIHSATAQIGEEKRRMKKETTGQNIMSAHLLRRAAIKSDVGREI